MLILFDCKVTVSEPNFSPILPGMSLEELESLVACLNNHLDGMSTIEKEDEVINLIHNTGPRFIPGVRNVPFYLYAEDEEPPARADVDEEGRPINDLDKETIAVRQGKSGQAKRTKSYQSLPSTSSRLTDPKTDSEKSVMIKKKARMDDDKDRDKEKDREQPMEQEMPQAEVSCFR